MNMPSSNSPKDSARRERLQRLLDDENAKTVPTQQLRKTREPAKYRELLNSSHSVQYSHITRDDVSKSRRRQEEARARSSSIRSHNPTASSLNNPLSGGRPSPNTGMGGMNFTSTFQSKPENQHVNMLAERTRKAKAESEWTLMTQFEKTLADAEKEARRRKQAEMMAVQRDALDKQLQEKVRLKQMEDVDKAQELERLKAELEAFKLDQARTKEEIRAKEELVKVQRERQLKEVKEARQAEMERKKRKDAAELAAIQEQMAADKVAAEERRREAAKAMAVTYEENTRMQEAKTAAAKAQAEADEAMMQQYMARLEAEEEERARKLEEFRQNIALRGVKAGAIAVKEADDRAAKEQEMIEKFQRKKERDEKRKEKEQKKTRKKMQQEIEYTIEKQKALQAQSKAEEDAAAEAYAAMIQRTDAQAVADEEEKTMRTRLRNMEHRRFLEAQIHEREMRDTVDDVYMTGAERQLNNQILKEAVQTHPEEPAAKFVSATLR